jgi:hypothetical protein
MTFLFPGFLWALAALVIPILIHLFQLRRFKRIDFPNVRFLKDVAIQTRARKKVRHWLTLLARLLALACLVLAFAQPYIPRADATVSSGQRAVSIYVDDSWSMDGQNAGGRLLDQARKGAQDVIMGHSASDRFQVLTGRFEGRQQILTGRDEALATAAQAEVGPFSRPLSQVLARQAEALARTEAPVRRRFLFTDLQRATVDVERWSEDSTISTVIVPIASTNTDNLAIDSAWFASPVRRLGHNEELHVRIRNHGVQALENVPLRLTIDGRQRALSTFSVEGGALVDTVLRFTNDASGDHWGHISLTDRPVTFDDDLTIAYHTAERLRVSLISGGDARSDRSIGAVFTGDRPTDRTDSSHSFTVQPYRAFDLASLQRTDLVVLNALPDVPSGMARALKEFVDAGGSLAVFPPETPDAAALQALLGPFGITGPGRTDTAAMNVDRIDLQEPFYREVFTTMPRNVELPTVRLRHAFIPKPGADVLLRLQDGSPFLSAVRSGRGRVYICASPLSEEGGTFTRHALLPTSLLRMAELSRPMGTLYHIIGEEAVIPLDGVEVTGEGAAHLKGPEGVDMVPELRRSMAGTSLVLHDQDLVPGAYAVVLGTDTLQLLALDLPRTESDLSAFSIEGLRTAIAQRGLKGFSVLETSAEDLSLSLKELDQGVKLWKWFVIAALLFLTLEILLIRLER